MLQLNQISKAFPGVQALQHVSLTIKKGEVHAICGENGAGKSTLMHIIAGNLRPDTGNMAWEGQFLVLANNLEAQQCGIGIVYQERSLVPTLNIAENIFPNEKPANRWGFIRNRQLHKNAHALLERVGLSDLPTSTLITELTPGQQQMVEIAKSLALHPRLLILDEPTASITESETQTLFDLIKKLKKEQVAIIYISHRMAEIKSIADQASVLKDGMYQGTFEVATTTLDEIIHRMIGRELPAYVADQTVTHKIMLEVMHLSGKGYSDINFQLHAGEILGFAGLVGAGRTELAKAIFGANPYEIGSIRLHGNNFQAKHPQEAIRQGVVYVPEERKLLGIFPEMSVKDNLIAASMPFLFKNNWVDFHKIEEITQQYTTQLSIKMASSENLINQLSGGNQQKVMLARWLSTQPELLLIDEPTQGVDIGVKMEIYALLKKLAARGKGIMLISSELPELFLLADRIAIMHEGKLVKILQKEEATEDRILYFASGQYLQHRR